MTIEDSQGSLARKNLPVSKFGPRTWQIARLIRVMRLECRRYTDTWHLTLMRMPVFRRVGLTGRLENSKVVSTLERVRKFLSLEGFEIRIEDSLREAIGSQERFVTRADMGKECDLVVVVGGDGSLLGAARDLAFSGIPLVGINRGGLGFLADIPPEDVEAGIGRVLQGQYNAEEHFLLEGEVWREGELLGASPALNDVVLHHGTMARIIDMSIYADGDLVYRQRSDGLIVASPTGSTAYALSAGGPILYPSIDAIVIVPMVPHTLTSRPLLVPSNIEVTAVLDRTVSENPQVSFDSQVSISVRPGDRLTIRKHKHRLTLLYPLEHSFFASCRSKLAWASPMGSEETDS